MFNIGWIWNIGILKNCLILAGSGTGTETFPMSEPEPQSIIIVPQHWTCSFRSANKPYSKPDFFYQVWSGPVIFRATEVQEHPSMTKLTGFHISNTRQSIVAVPAGGWGIKPFATRAKNVILYPYCGTEISESGLGSRIRDKSGFVSQI